MNTLITTSLILKTIIIMLLLMIIVSCVPNEAQRAQEKAEFKALDSKCKKVGVIHITSNNAKNKYYCLEQDTCFMFFDWMDNGYGVNLPLEYCKKEGLL